MLDLLFEDWVFNGFSSHWCPCSTSSIYSQNFWWVDVSDKRWTHSCWPKKWFPRFCWNIFWLQASYPISPYKCPNNFQGGLTPPNSRSCHGSSMRSWSPRSPSQKDMALCGKVRSRFAWIPWQLGVFDQKTTKDWGKVCGKCSGGGVGTQKPMMPMFVNKFWLKTVFKIKWML